MEASEDSLDPASQYSPISSEEAYRALSQHPAWVVERNRLHRDVRMRSFAAAVALITRVAAAAEALRHHPNIRLHEWCFVEFEVYSHVTGGLTQRDVALAVAIDSLLEDA